MLFSIIIPAYNVEDYIEDCLGSVSQSLERFHLAQEVEVIIVNDGSTDLTWEKILHVTPRAHVISHIKNQGPPASRNSGVRQASGEYVIFLDADNRLSSNALTDIYDTIRSRPQDDAIILGMDIIDPQGKIIGTFYGDKVKVDPQAQLESAPVLLLLGNFLDNFSVVKRSVFDSLLYDESLQSLEDWDLWVRLLFLRRGQISFQPKICGQYRSRTGPKMAPKNRGTLTDINDVITIYAKILLLANSCPIPEQIVDKIYEAMHILSAQLSRSSAYRNWRENA